MADLDFLLIDAVDLFDPLASIRNLSMVALRSQAFRLIWPLLYCGHWENLVPPEYRAAAELLSYISHASDYGYLLDTSVVPDWLSEFGSAIKPNPGRRVVFPSLKTISVSSLDSENLPQACILAMSRLASGLPLEAVKAFSMNGKTSPVLTLLEEHTNVEMIM